MQKIFLKNLNNFMNEKINNDFTKKNHILSESKGSLSFYSLKNFR